MLPRTDVTTIAGVDERGGVRFADGSDRPCDIGDARLAGCCARCGYNFAGLGAEQSCPECSAARMLSLDALAVRGEEAALRSLARGVRLVRLSLRWLLVGVALLVIAPLLFLPLVSIGGLWTGGLLPAATGFVASVAATTWFVGWMHLADRRLLGEECGALADVCDAMCFVGLLVAAPAGVLFAMSFVLPHVLLIAWLPALASLGVCFGPMFVAMPMLRVLVARAGDGPAVERCVRWSTWFPWVTLVGAPVLAIGPLVGLVLIEKTMSALYGPAALASERAAGVASGRGA